MATGEYALFFKIYLERGGDCENLDCDKTDMRFSEVQHHHVLTKGSRPDLRLDPNNIVVLCMDCHNLAHVRGNSALNLPEKYLTHNP